jgi:hypothetical protein
MTVSFFAKLFLLGVFSFSAAMMSGCNRATAEPENKVADDHDGHSHGPGKKAHSHDAWWCDEHGVPEDVCGLCDPKVAATMQKKGDWCKEHDRPDSQCFVCHPELEARFAAKYVAKYGKQPPKPE